MEAHSFKAKWGRLQFVERVRGIVGGVRKASQLVHVVGAFSE